MFSIVGTFKWPSLIDYKTNKRKSLLKRIDGTEYICGLPALDKFFGSARVADIEATRTREFIAKRTEEAVPNATINRSLALLRRMLNRAKQDRRLRFVPHSPMLKENNVREGLFVNDQYTLVCDALPDYPKPVLAMGYFTGIREGEILPFLWSQVSFKDNHALLDQGRQRMTHPAQSLWLGLGRQDNLSQFPQLKKSCIGPVHCRK